MPTDGTEIVEVGSRNINAFKRIHTPKTAPGIV